MSSIKTKKPVDQNQSLVLLDKSRLVAEIMHGGQKYGSKPYMFHLRECVQLACDLHFDKKIQSAMYLHDIVEDCETSIDFIENEFGSDLAYIVLNLTNDQLKDKNISNKIYYGRIMTDFESSVCKIIDRSCNLKNILDKSPQKLISKYLFEDKFIQNIIEHWKNTTAAFSSGGRFNDLVKYYQDQIARIKTLQDPFLWTDELVLEFSKKTQRGSYGDFEGCKTIESKLEKFKRINGRKN